MILPKKMTTDECYKPSLEITDPDEAKEYLEALIERSMKYFDNSREEAERIEKGNLGYYCGYYGTEAMIRVHKLFDCEHEIFGKVESADDLPSDEEIFEMGRKWAEDNVSRV